VTRRGAACTADNCASSAVVRTTPCETLQQVVEYASNAPSADGLLDQLANIAGDDARVFYKIYMAFRNAGLSNDEVKAKVAMWNGTRARVHACMQRTHVLTRVRAARPAGDTLSRVPMTRLRRSTLVLPPLPRGHELTRALICDKQAFVRLWSAVFEHGRDFGGALQHEVGRLMVVELARALVPERCAPRAHAARAGARGPALNAARAACRRSLLSWTPTLPPSS
jgi:hypothetical protein